jgi:GAF domain-containing protein
VSAQDDTVPTDDRPALPDKTPLPAAPDLKFDSMAALARRVLKVPVALVSLVDRTHQVMPGAVGLPESWQEQRSTPLSQSICQFVVLDAAPVVITDTRVEPRVRDNLALTDVDVVAYAGMPLVDLDGGVVGSLCAIDSRPREWSEEELDTLADLAGACSAELQLRSAVGRAAVADERERIVEHLQHDVFGELLGLMMTLTRARSVSYGPVALLMDGALRDLEALTASLRSVLFDRPGV